MDNMENVFCIIAAVRALMLRHQKFYCTHARIAVLCVSRGHIAKVKALSPESTTTAAGLCVLRGLPGTRLGRFFGGSLHRAFHPLSEERCDCRHQEYSTFERSNCASRNEFLFNYAS